MSNSAHALRDSASRDSSLRDASLRDLGLPDQGFDPILRFEQVTRRFGTRTVLDQLDLSVARGKITVILGGSGSGKSTILKTIMGFLAPDAGRVLIDGHNPNQLRGPKRLALLRSIGMSFQYAALFDSMTVFDNVAFPLREHTRLNEKAIRPRVLQTLQRLGLHDTEDKNPAELSGGMRKRLGVARAIMLQPRIMLFDEPESGLDPITTTSIGELIMELRDTLGITCLVISHHLQNAMHIADEVAMLYRGRIIAKDTPQKIQEHPNPILQQFLQGQAEGPYQA